MHFLGEKSDGNTKSTYACSQLLQCFIPHLFIQERVSLRAMLFAHFLVTHPEAVEYHRSLICWPPSSSTGAVGLKSLAPQRLSGGNEEASKRCLSLAVASSFKNYNLQQI